MSHFHTPPKQKARFDPSLVDCDKCGAKPGEACRTKHGDAYIRTYHARRWDEARAGR